MGQKAIKEVIWGKRAIKQLHAIYLYIAQDSSQNAIKVRNAIADKAVRVSVYPESFPIDKFKKFNKGNYRVFIRYIIIKSPILLERIISGLFVSGIPK
jgi:plasmid stabilization system protein ParE